jgi:hypothetical protein
MSSLVFWQRFLTVDLSLSLGSRTDPVPQLPASKSNSSQGLNRSNPLSDSHSLTHSPTKSLHATDYFSGWRPSHTKPLFYSLPSQDSPLMAAGLCIASTRTAQRTPSLKTLPLLLACLLQSLPSNGRCLQSHYLATAVVRLLISRSLLSNGSTCHNSCQVYGV